MKRTEPYTGPFPRKRHSHRCKNCDAHSIYSWNNAVACYKSQCTKPQTIEYCDWCKPVLNSCYAPYATKPYKENE